MERARTAALERREFVRHEWLSSGLLFLALLPAEDDLPETNKAYKKETWAISRSLDALGITPVGITIGPGSYWIGQWTGPITMFTLALAPVVLPAVTKIIVTWLKARSGRKVRAQIGDIKVEAQTEEEVEKLLQYAMELCQNVKNNKNDKPDLDDAPAQAAKKRKTKANR